MLQALQAGWFLILIPVQVIFNVDLFWIDGVY